MSSGNEAAGEGQLGCWSAASHLHLSIFVYPTFQANTCCLQSAIASEPNWTNPIGGGDSIEARSFPSTSSFTKCSSVWSEYCNKLLVLSIWCNWNSALLLPSVVSSASLVWLFNGLSSVCLCLVCCQSKLMCKWVKSRESSLQLRRRHPRNGLIKMAWSGDLSIVWAYHLLTCTCCPIGVPSKWTQLANAHCTRESVHLSAPSVLSLCPATLLHAFVRVRPSEPVIS